MYSRYYKFCSGISSTGRLQHVSINKRTNLHQCRDIVGRSWIPEATPREFLSHDSQQCLQLRVAEGPTSLQNTRSATDKASIYHGSTTLASQTYFGRLLSADIGSWYSSRILQIEATFANQGIDLADETCLGAWGF